MRIADCVVLCCFEFLLNCCDTDKVGTEMHEA